MGLSLPFGHSRPWSWTVPSRVPQASQARWHSTGQDGAASVSTGLNPTGGTGAIAAASLQKVVNSGRNQ